MRCSGSGSSSVARLTNCAAPVAPGKQRRKTRRLRGSHAPRCKLSSSSKHLRFWRLASGTTQWAACRADGDDALATPDTQDATAGAGSKVEAGMYGRPPPAEAFDDLICRFQAQIAKVKTFLDEQGLRNHHPCCELWLRVCCTLAVACACMPCPSGPTASPRARLCDPTLHAAVLLSTSVRGQLLTLIKESLGICRDLLRVEGVDVIELLQHQDEAAMAAPAAPGSSMRRKWLHVIRALQLMPTQQQQLLLLRSAHLTLMRRIYGQRQQLNMQAMSLMLAGSSGMQPAGGGQAAKLAAVLGSIKESLRREQRAAMEINATTLARILSPVQAALYISEAFPLHCDALGLWCVLVWHVCDR